MGVIDDDQERAPGRRVGEDRQGREADQEGSGGGGVGDPERGIERVHLRAWQRLDVVEERKEQLVESGESQLHLRFDSDQSNDLEVGGPGNHVVDQRGLAHAGFAPQDERGTEPAAN